MAGKKPTIPFILTLVGGIIILLYAIVLIIGAYVITSFLGSSATNSGSASAITSQLSSVSSSVAAGTYLQGAIGIICGLVLTILSIMIRNGQRNKVFKLSIVMLAFSIISLFGGAGLFIGLALALIGSILGLLYKS